MVDKQLQRISVDIPGTQPLWRMARLVALLAFPALLLKPAAAQVLPPDDIKVEEKFPLSQPAASQESNGLDIYVDGSMSMRGYVEPANSVYRRVVRELVESATIGHFDLTIYKFARKLTAITHLPLNQLQSPGFYDGQDTPLAAILNRVAESPSRAAIIITDLVQSQSGTDELVLAEALGRLLSHANQISLLAYRSSFDGMYYSESHHGTSLKLTVSQSLPGIGRPFYLLAIAPNAQTMKRLDAYLLSHIPPVEIVRPSEPAISVNAVSLSTHGGKELPWRLYKPATQRDSALVHRITAAYRLTRATEPQDELPLDFKIHTSIPIRNPNRLNCEARKITWRGGLGFNQLSQVKMEMTGEFAKDGQNLHLQFFVSRPELGSWDIYLLRMRPGQGNLDVPAWVNAWSTDDDVAIANGNRTFQLRLIVQSMLNEIAENSVFLEYILEVGR